MNPCALTNFRAAFHAVDPPPKDDGLRQIPHDDKTRPTPQQLHLAEQGIARLKRRNGRTP